MIRYDVLEAIEKFVPTGQRSNFVNEAIEKAISILKREIAFKEMDKLRDKHKLKMSDKEIIRLKNYGRK